MSVPTVVAETPTGQAMTGNDYPCTAESIRLARDAATREREAAFQQIGNPAIVATLRARVAAAEARVTR